MEPLNPPTEETVRSARRRLVRGAFAAPAVLALYSGSAAAMASNLRCVNNQVGPGQKHFNVPPVATQDRFVRVRLWSLRHDGEVRWFLRGNDFAALTLGRSSVGNTFLTSGEWWQFDPAGQQLVGLKLNAEPRWSGHNNGTLAHDGQWVAVRIDATSQGAGIVGVVDKTNFTGSAVSGLCWASFVTAAR